MLQNSKPASKICWKAASTRIVGNDKWKALLAQVEAALKNPTTRVRAILCYSGLALVSEDRKRLFETLKARFRKDEEDDYFQFQSVNITTLNEWMTENDDDGIEAVELEIVRPGMVTQPYETIYGLIALERLKSLHEQYGAKLIRANIRGFKGKTDVNDDIQKTLAEEVGLFHYLNNGLTAYCERLELNNLDRANAERKRVTARGFAIVNGAQTLGSIWETAEAPKEEGPLLRDTHS